MKTTFASLALISATLFASCRSYDGNDADVVRNDDATIRAQQYSLDSMKFEMARQNIIDSMTEVARVEREAALEEQAVALSSTRAARSTGRSSGGTRASSASAYSSGSYAGSGGGYSQPQPVYTEPKKRGWSAKAKGAVIGAGVGAASGAVINKRDRAKGAIIGGVLGAGAGTGVGAVIDRKNGR